MSAAARIARLVCSCLGAALLGSCTIGAPSDGTPAPIENTCASHRDCSLGSCNLEVGRCSRGGTQFDTLLVEVMPPLSDQRYGGREFIQRLRFDAATTHLDVTLREPPRVNGLVTLWLGDCDGHTIQVSLRRRVEALGLGLVRYSAESGSDFARRLDGHKDYSRKVNPFSLGSVPAGAYDVYWKDVAGEEPTVDCPAPAVPQLLRNFVVSEELASVPFSFDQTTPEPSAFSVEVPFTPELQDWAVDIVHNITGERLSTRATIDQAAAQTVDGRVTVTLPIRSSRVSGTDYAITTTAGGIFAGAALLRLRPPDTSQRPTIYFAGLVPTDVTASPTIAIPPVGPFSGLVHYRAWVWGEGDANRPVPGRVRFAASSLVDVKGASVSFTQTVTIGADGSLGAELLPGNYVVDVMPEQGSGFGRYRTSLTIWGPPPGSDSGTVQAGQLLSIPRAPKLRGVLRGPGGIAPTGSRVEIRPIVRGGFTPTGQVPRFTPRSDAALVDETGRFEVEVDCGSCTEETPVAFDIVVEPPDGSGLSWTVYRDVALTGDLDLGRVDLEVPRILTGQVAFQRSATRPPVPYAGPRVRAYAMIDRTGSLVVDPLTPDCIDRAPAVDGEVEQPCVQKVIQVADVTTDGAGRFELPLPGAFGVLD